MQHVQPKTLRRPFTQAIDALNLQSSETAAREIITLALKRARRPIVTTKFGPHSAVLLHLLSQQAPNVPVVWIDTTFNTSATLRFAERLQRLLDLNLKVYRPDAHWHGMVPEPDTPEHAAFTQQVKLAPFSRALEELQPDIWFSSLRRSQSDHRSTQHAFNSSSADLLKACPLIHWSENDVATYMLLNDLPGEDDHHDPTKAGPRRECGLHLKF